MLAAHEYVENRLMEEGIPFRPSDPAVWDEDGVAWPDADHPSAHDLSILEGVPNAPFRHWRRWGSTATDSRWPTTCRTSKRSWTASCEDWTDDT